MIENVRRQDVQSTHINVRLGELFALSDVELVDLENERKPEVIGLSLPHIIKPGEYVLGKTIEAMNQKDPKYAVLLTMQVADFDWDYPCRQDVLDRTLKVP